MTFDNTPPYNYQYNYKYLFKQEKESKDSMTERSQVPPGALDTYAVVTGESDATISIETNTTGHVSRQIRLYKGIWPQERVDGKWRLLPEIRESLKMLFCNTVDSSIAVWEDGEMDDQTFDRMEIDLLRASLGPDVLEADK